MPLLDVPETPPFRSRIVIVAGPDSPSFLDQAITRAGCEVVEILYPGESAIGRVAAIDPDVIIVDTAVAAALQFLDQLSATPSPHAHRAVLVLTGDARQSARRSLLAAGASDLLVKPFELAELVLRLGHQLDIRRLETELSQRHRELQERLDRQLEARLDDRDFFYEEMAAAQESERARLAADIHDDALQCLAAVALRLESLDRRHHLGVGMGEERWAELPEIVETIRETSEKLRTLVFGVPVPSGGRDLLHALRARVAELAGSDRIAVGVVDESHVALPAPVVLVLWRIGHEAIGNAVNHASCESLILQLTTEANVARLLVIDDGQGFDPDELAPTTGHVGLRLMNERARRVGGQVTITSRLGGGTTCEVTVPLRARTTGRDEGRGRPPGIG